MVIGTISNDVKRLIIFRMPENRMLVVNILFLLFLIYLEMMLIFKFFIYSYYQSNQLQFDFCLAVSKFMTYVTLFFVLHVKWI